jgi:hypothetical protein
MGKIFVRAVQDRGVKVVVPGAFRHIVPALWTVIIVTATVRELVHQIRTHTI